jgi:hypothetical protein
MMVSERSESMKQPKKNPAAVRLGRRGGLANTPAQHAARAKNAQHAGRPRRVCDCCGAPVRGGHVDPRQDTRCQRPGWHWETPAERAARRAKH